MKNPSLIKQSRLWVDKSRKMTVGSSLCLFSTTLKRDANSLWCPASTLNLPGRGLRLNSWRAVPQTAHTSSRYTPVKAGL